MQQGILLLGIFFLELVGLFFISRLLTEVITKLLYHMTRSRSTTIHILSFLFLPGTIIHELSHVLVAGVMMVEVGDIEFLPEIKEDRVKLGSAQIGRTDPFRRGLIGLAPVLVGIGLIVTSLLVFYSHFSSSIVAALLIIYLLFEISNTMFSSSKDMEGFILFIGLILGLVVALSITNLVNFASLAGSVFTPNVTIFLEQLCLSLLIPLVVDLMVLLLAKLVHKRL